MAALPPGVSQSQIIPTLNNILDQQIQRFPTGLVEPRSTFRFTIRGRSKVGVDSQHMNASRQAERVPRTWPEILEDVDEIGKWESL